MPGSTRNGLEFCPATEGESITASATAHITFWPGGSYTI